MRMRIFPGLYLICVLLWVPSQGSYSVTDSEYKRFMGEGFIYMESEEPEGLRYTFKLSPSSFTPQWNITFKKIGLVLSDPPCGCGEYLNSEMIENKIAFIKRGDCSYFSKGIRAQEAGAIAAIVSDNDAENDNIYIDMADDLTGREVRIPMAFLHGKNGHVVRNTMQKLGLTEISINIPINISNISVEKLNQPPWLVW